MVISGEKWIKNSKTNEQTNQQAPMFQNHYIQLQGAGARATTGRSGNQGQGVR